MLSLFFGAGICRILRYRSSNTSMVDSVTVPALFFGKTTMRDGTLRTEKNRKTQRGTGGSRFPPDVRNTLGGSLRPAPRQCRMARIRPYGPAGGTAVGVDRFCRGIPRTARDGFENRGTAGAMHRAIRAGTPLSSGPVRRSARPGALRRRPGAGGGCLRDGSLKRAGRLRGRLHGRNPSARRSAVCR